MTPAGGDRTRRGGIAGVLLALVVVVCVAAIALLLVARLGRREAVVTSGSTSAARDGGSARPPNAAERGAAQATASGAFDGCPPEGDGGDRALNRLKNREAPSALRDTPFDSVLLLAIPDEASGRYRSRWPKRVSALVAPIERRAVRVEGYVARARLSGPEATNCHGDAARYRDYHVWITATPTPDRSRSVIAEMTPRFRARHSGWTVERLGEVARRHDPVRVGGWLMLDQEHPEQIGRTRGTLWEIHPITSFEVWRGGRWIALDDLPTRGGGR